MIEHVGHDFVGEFFSCCDSALAEDGLLVLQFISIPDERYDSHRHSTDFMREYIFPGGSFHALSHLTSAMAAESRLCVEHLENIGIHYYQTLRCWRKNFLKNKSQIRALGFDDEFIRTWEYYFDYCGHDTSLKIRIRIPMGDLIGGKGAEKLSEIGFVMQIVSMGHQVCGALELWNYPVWMRDLVAQDVDGTDRIDHVDLAAPEIYRDRERSVARYNEFRRRILKIPISNWRDLTNDEEVIETLQEVYVMMWKNWIC